MSCADSQADDIFCGSTRSALKLCFYSDSIVPLFISLDLLFHRSKTINPEH